MPLPASDTSKEDTEMTTSAPAPVQTAEAASVPGKTLGIVGLVLAILAPLVGLILSIVAKSQSKKAGVKNGPATAGIWVSIVLMVVTVVIIGISVAMSMTAVNAALEVCSQLGEGIYEIDGVTYTCG
jgi:heme/copper-type cytochrome/quinol oxidase subunit 2